MLYTQEEIKARNINTTEAPYLKMLMDLPYMTCEELLLRWANFVLGQFHS